MTTWLDFLSDIREDMKDTRTTPKWSDQLLYLYTRDAIRDYSQWFPRRVNKTELAEVTAGQYTLPSDYVADLFIENPENSFLERRQVQPGLKYPVNRRALYYYVDGGSLYLVGTAETGGVFLSYYAVHAVPASETEDDFVMTVPDVDLELIRLHVKAKAYEQLWGKQAGLDRFKGGSGSRTDNPIEPEFANLMEDYRRKINERYVAGSFGLHRKGRN